MKRKSKKRRAFMMRGHAFFLAKIGKYVPLDGPDEHEWSVWWTALEALFFLEDEFQDMGKSLALAASSYSGKNSSECSTIYHDLTRSHTLRSFYIWRKKTKHPLDEMVAKKGEHLRRALRRRIEE